MIRFRLILWAMFFASLFLTGCGPEPLAPVQLETMGVKPAVSFVHLGEVMKWLINKQGYVEPLRMEDVDKQLHGQLQLFAVTGPDITPKLFPTKADRLAYWYNARAGWSIRLAMDLYIAKQKTALGLNDRSFPIDGQRMTLNKIDAKLDALGGFKCVVASPSMQQNRATMPREPFDPKTIEQDIQQRFDEYLSDRHRFIIDIEKQQIQFPPAFWRYRQQILADHIRQYGTPQPTLTTALLPMLKGLARYRLQNAIGYACVQSPEEGKITVKGDD